MRVNNEGSALLFRVPHPSHLGVGSFLHSFFNNFCVASYPCCFAPCKPDSHEIERLACNLPELRQESARNNIRPMHTTQLRSAIKTALPWALVAFFVALGLLSDIFRMTQAVIAGFVAVVAVFACALAGRSARIGFSRKFPFVQFLSRSIRE